MKMKKGIAITLSAVTVAVFAVGAVLYKRHLDERNRFKPAEELRIC